MTLPTNKYMKTVFLFFLLMAYPVSGIHYSIMCVAQTQSEDEIEFKKCLTKAQAGDVDAQAKLGYCYLKGEGVAQNYEKAMEWSAKAAEQGNARGQSNLGWCYQKGYGVPQNDEKAVEWYAKAAEQGYATAQCNLGFCYERGIGIPENYEKAVEWYTKAAEQGDANGNTISALVIVLAKVYRKTMKKPRNGLLTLRNKEMPRHNTILLFVIITVTVSHKAMQKL